jgi:hypothetical protein
LYNIVDVGNAPVESPPGRVGDKIIHAHYTCQHLDWYIHTYNPTTGISLAWVVNRNNSMENRWKPIDLRGMIFQSYSHGLELVRDKHWTPTRKADI